MAQQIVGYVYRAEIYCPFHIISQITTNPGDSHHKGSPMGKNVEEIERHLNVVARINGVNRTDHYSFDSDKFPKEIYSHEDTGDSQCGICNTKI